MRDLCPEGVSRLEKLTSILAASDNVDQVDAVLERSVALARCFRARVEFLVTDAATARAVSSRCREQDLSMVSLYSVDAGSHSFSEVILRRVLSSRPDLVVKPPAAGAPMRRFSFQESDWELANECPVPLLLARGPSWQSPPRFATAVDVADPDHINLARKILHAAGFLALGTHGNLDILYTEREAHDEAVRMERAVVLAQLVREFHVGCERLQMFGGEPEKRLPPLFAARHYDVLVLGGESRREGMASLIPGTVARIMDATDSDVVLVKAPAAISGTYPARSAREQRAHQREQFA
jgi:hypothetical protein